MENLTQQQIEALIQFIDGAEDPATVTNTIVAAVLAFLADKAAGMATAQALLEEVVARQTADTNLSTRIAQLQQLIQSIGSVVYLDSMGELDGDADIHVDTGMVVYDSENDIIKKYTTPSQYETISCDTKLLYCNKVTGYFYRYSTQSGMLQVGGGGGISEEDIINDLTTGGRKKALSAEMGKWLALMSGTYEQAWSRSKVVTSPFCWIWDDTLSDGPIRKPIWHIGNSVFIDAAGSVVGVSAGDRPGTPSFSINGTTPTDNMEVARNTQLTITPVAGAVLKYSIDDAEYITSDGAVTVTLTGSGTKTIKAYCSNSAGDSDLRTLRLVVSGIPEPSFTAGQDTTITTIGNDRIVTRGGVIVITGDEELHYRVGGGTWRTVSSSHGEAPTARVTIDGDKTVEAYNTVDGEKSGTVSWSFKMDALDAPSFNPASGEVTAGSSVTITAPAGATLKVNGTAIQSQTTTVTITTNNQTITAVSVDAYGESVAATETYTIAVAKIKVKVNAAGTTMKLGIANGGTTTVYDFALDNVGDTLNEITIENINTATGNSYQSLADVTFESLAFSDNTKIVTFDGGGMKVKSLNSTFSFEFSANGASLTEVKGIVVAVDKDGNGNITGGGDIFKAFNEAQNLTNLEISGTVNGNMQYAFHRVGFRVSKKCVIDISGLEGKPSVLTNAFDILKKTDELDISGIDTSAATQMNSVFEQGAFAKLVIGNFADSNAVDNNVFAYFAANKFTTLECKSQTPPSLKASNSWLKQLADTQSSFTTIIVPDGCLGDASDSTKYAGADVWKDYASKMVEKSNYNNN